MKCTKTLVHAPGKGLTKVNRYQIVLGFLKGHACPQQPHAVPSRRLVGRNTSSHVPRRRTRSTSRVASQHFDRWPARDRLGNARSDCKAFSGPLSFAGPLASRCRSRRKGGARTLILEDVDALSADSRSSCCVGCSEDRGGPESLRPGPAPGAVGRIGRIRRLALLRVERRSTSGLPS